MWNSRNRTATLIVFSSLRKYTGAIRADIRNFHLDAERSEELDEAIRLTRTMRSATSLIGSYELNRVASLLEQTLESIAHQESCLDDVALSVLLTILESIDAYTLRIESRIQQSSRVMADDRQELIAAVKTFRRFHDFPEEGDHQAISSLFATSPAFTDGDGARFPAAARENELPGESTSPGAVAVAGDAGQANAPDALAADFFRQHEISPELWEVFQEEANDHVDRIYAALRQLEKNHGDRERIQEVRRSAHTLKGAAGAVGLRGVTQLAHRMEDLLDALYEGAMPLDSELLSLLAATTDALHDLFAGNDVSESDVSESDDEAPYRKLRELYAAYDAHCGRATEEHAAKELAGNAELPGRESLSSDMEHATQPAPGPQRSSGAVATNLNLRQPTFVRVPTSRLDGLRRVVSELVVNRTSTQQGIARFGRCVGELQPVLDMLRDVCRDMESLREAGGLRDAWRSSGEQRILDGPLLASCKRDSTEFDELEFDRYTNFDLWSQSLTEAATVIGTVRHDLRSLVDECDSLLAQQSRLTLETQDRLFRIQMVALSTILPRLDRALREVATREGKAVELVVEGDDVELDKTVLEEMAEPLLHLIRNAVDHGIEPAEQRAAKGKPAVACVHISLSNVGTQVVLRVRDDGRGLDAAKIRAAAVKRGHVSQAEADSLTPQALYRHIFLPGFSTASSISEISGRGVGMDVVHSKIEELEGRIDVESVADRGTCFTIRLPVRLAVAQALMLTVDDQLYALPQKAVNAIIRVAKGDVQESHETSQICIDGTTLPLIHLRDYLGLETPGDRLSDTLLVAILGTGAQQIALHVDGILPGRDIVVKPVEKQLATASGLLGATILGDGTVVPILDPMDLLASADTETFAMTAIAEDRSGDAPKTSVMIVDDSVSVRRVLQNVVEHAGWSSIAARDGMDALKVLSTLRRPPTCFCWMSRCRAWTASNCCASCAKRRCLRIRPSS